VSTAGRAGQLASHVAGLLADPSCVPAALAGQPWWGQSLARGAPGIALLHIERAAAGQGPWQRARDWLSAATREPVTAGADSHLFHGAPALAYVLSRAAAAGQAGSQQTLMLLNQAITRQAEDRLRRAHRRLDSGLLPELAEFDLIRGLTGFGAWFLQHDPASSTLRGILMYLTRLAGPATLNGLPVPGWWTPVSPSGQYSARFEGGHANLGVAHGIGGPLALLALAARRGIIAGGQQAAISRICGWLRRWHTADPAQPAWPYWISLPGWRQRDQPKCWPQRLGWCYGTAGLARAVQLAGLATGDQALRVMAEDTLVTALASPANQAALTGMSLCHGRAGLARIALAAAGDAGSTTSARLRGLARELLDTIVAPGSDPAAIAGTLAHDPAGPGFLDGAAGVALTMLADRTGTCRGWDTCLLIT
jgi:lantibiotic biosynthesis protein